MPNLRSVQAAPAMRPIPVVIVASERPYSLKPSAESGSPPPGIPLHFGPVIFKAHLAGQRTLAGRPNARLILNTKAGHSVQTEQPALTIKSIDLVAGAARTKPNRWLS